MNVLSVFFGRIRAYYFGILRLNIIQIMRVTKALKKALAALTFI